MEATDGNLLVASLDFVRRTGAAQAQVRFSDDEKPLRAALRLLDQLIDGGQCLHCKRPTGVSETFDGAMPLDDLLCWYRYDPELKTFRRGCEGAR